MKTYISFLLLIFSLFSFAQNEDNRIYFEVDKLATYQGDYSKFSEYISDNINCKININRKVKNEIQIRFIVEKNGEIKTAEILSTKPFKCKDQIILALKANRNWNPAIKDKLPVRSIVQMDINLNK